MVEEVVADHLDTGIDDPLERWPQVANLSVKVETGRVTSKTVIVRAIAGRRIRLAVPTYGILTSAEFTGRSQQIQDYWRAALGAAAQVERP